jgi:hypothetical protein
VVSAAFKGNVAAPVIVSSTVNRMSVCRFMIVGVLFVFYRGKDSGTQGERVSDLIQMISIEIKYPRIPSTKGSRGHNIEATQLTTKPDTL